MNTQAGLAASPSFPSGTWSPWKTKNYLGDYQKQEEERPFGVILGILRKNSGRLGVSLSDAKEVGRIRQEYEKSLAVLLPIKRRLAATDWLIDQLVYRLYGLTEEEVRIVEGIK